MSLFLRHLLFLIFLLNTLTVRADGSKDLYPNGVRGARACMETEVFNGPIRYHNFYNNGRHFAYLKINEVLAVASSAQGMGNGTIRVYSPSGRVFNPIDLNIGKIQGRNGLTNRQAELAGPRIGYDAFEIIAEEEGIWTVEFTSPGNSSDLPNIYANDDWWQDNNDNFITAWDVSVRNAANTQWISGRVFANVINLHLNGGSMTNPDLAYYGVNYVMTKDGYYYSVDGNGSIGLRFTYFVNNSGILDANNGPSYKSSRLGFYAPVHNPNGPDLENEFVTHKIFYTLPSHDLPKISRSQFGETWLLNQTEIPIVNDVKIGSSESTEKHINSKGAMIYFTTNYAGRYQVIVETKNPAFAFTPRMLIVQGVIGNNEVWWDGRDGDNNLIPKGQYELTVRVASIEGEVHFPYFDMEINPNGLKLERLDRATGKLSGAMLYWDDSDIPLGSVTSEHANPIVNLLGISSYVNGHRFGTYSSPQPGYRNNDNLGTGNYSYGNNMAIDTWSYAVQVEETATKDIIVEIADLEVVDVRADKDTIELDESVNYTINVKNNGPSDVIKGNFEYALPEGFIIDDLKLLNSDCATMSSPMLSKNTLKVSVDIKNGCEAIFVIRTHAHNVPDATYGTVLAEAGIVRPIGFTDPDATLNDIAINAPKSAKEECSPDGCNNIKSNTDVFLLEPYNERGQFALLKTVQHIDATGSGFQSVGETLTYTFTVRNIGEVDLSNIVITDSMLNPLHIPLSNVILRKNEEHSVLVNYTITAADVQRKQVINQASILAKNPRTFDVKDLSGTTFSNNDSTVIAIDQKPVFQLRKLVHNTGTGENSQFTIGDKIIYRFEIKHQGDIAVHDIELSDSLLFTSAQSVHTGILNNNSIHFDFEYYVSAEDIERGFIENSANVTSFDVKYGKVLTDISGTTFDNNEITVTTLAKPPIAIADFIEIIQGVTTALPIIENDEKGSSNWDKGRIEIIENPTLGRMVINGTSVIYQQNNNFENGADYFTYRIHDNSRLTSEIVRVDLLIVKTVPIAQDDIYLQYYNSKIRINPAENDYVEHSELDIESITIINQPLNGRLHYLGNGMFEYISDKTFSGIDEFTYSIQDKNGNWSDPATVKIEVSGILIPNVITPNGDGLNDTFEIIGLYQFESVSIQVFDRFKNLIYQNPNYQNDWQVSSVVRDGTYFYVLRMNKLNEKPIVKKGSLLITREMLN